MHQVNARHDIIREWRSLPKELRQTDEQAAAFAMQIKDTEADDQRLRLFDEPIPLRPAGSGPRDIRN
jgi:hypothetical protein